MNSQTHFCGDTGWTIFDATCKCALFVQTKYTVNSLMFARDLFGEFHHHLEIAKLNTPQT